MNTAVADLGGPPPAQPLPLLPRLRQWFSAGRLIGLVLPAAVLLLWQIAASREWIDPVFLPEPISLAIVSQGFFYGALAALVLGVGAGLSKRFEQFLSPTFDTIRHIPGIAWFPLIVLWLGLGAPAKILVIAKSVFFPVFLNTLQGIRSVDRSYIELAEALTLTRWQLVRKVILPAATPTIMVSLRYAAGLAWALVVVAEGLSGLEGLGFLIFRAQGLLLTDQLLVCMVVIGLVGFAIDRTMYLLQRRVLRWKQGFEG
jgi:sulfonate transport system permease protein